MIGKCSTERKKFGCFKDFVDSTEPETKEPMDFWHRITTDAIDINTSISRFKKLEESEIREGIINIFTPSNKLINETVSSALYTSIINDFKNKFNIKINQDVNKILAQDVNLVFALHKIKTNLEFLENFDFNIEGLDYNYDPEEPDWKILTIFIKINENNLDKLIDIRDKIIEKLCRDIDLETLKKFSIVNLL